ncbi:MAG TPA: ABC transporter ATP-binding protein [Planctomycetota bacterium]|nr:ABC transporter ATP-binding protein [Planctomycetota bacterium]
MTEPPPPPSPDTMIEIRKLRKVYGEKIALHELDLSVKAGEVFAFLGPNGAGKTTTIKILSGLLRPTSGDAFVAGFDLSVHGLQARSVMSYVPDEPYLYEKLTAREFLNMIGDLYGMKRELINERIEAVSRTFELSEFIDTLCESYSHGMKQRTVIAAALLHEPRLLVIDEPMVGLDPKSARTVKDTLKALAKEKGMTVFMSTHTLSVAEETADRIGILSHGRLAALGTLDEIRQVRAKGTGSDGKERLEDLFLELTRG